MAKSSCCYAHGPDCEHEGHPHISLDIWRSGQGLCGECGEREGTVKWGEGIQVARGHYTLRCEQCALEAQIERIYERLEELPGLERRLAEIL